MAKKSTGRPVGRPKGTRTATVELKTVSFKASVALLEQVERYAREHRLTVSELLRDGLKMRLEGVDPRDRHYEAGNSGETAYEGNTGNTKGVEVGVEFLHGMLSALVEEVRQLRGVVQALEQRLGEPGSVQPTGGPDIAGVVDGDGDIPEASVRAQSMVDHAPAEVDRQGQPEGVDPAKFRLGRLCKGGHAYRDTGQTLYRLPKFVCPKCDAERAQERRQAKRQQVTA